MNVNTMNIAPCRVFQCVMISFLGLTACSVQAENNHRINVVIDKETTIVPAADNFERAMMSMVRHPDGSIYLNTQTQAVLYRSVDHGATWETVAIRLPATTKKQVQHGLGVSRDGRLCSRRGTR